MKDYNVSYRSATMEDFDFIYCVEKESFSEIDRFHIYQIKHFLRNPNKTIFTDIILFSNEKAGYAVFFARNNTNNIRLYSFGIKLTFRGKGIAENYLRAKINDFSNKYKYISLEVRVDNLPAIKLYEKVGFKIVNRIKNYYKDGEDAYKMIYNYK